MKDINFLFTKLKGGKGKIETKSRYEVIADAEERKRKLILERDGLDKSLKARKQTIKNLKRELEDEEEEVKNFEESLEQQKVTLNELIKSIDESLKRLGELNTSKKSA